MARIHLTQSTSRHILLVLVNVYEIHSLVNKLPRWFEAA